jgi:uncharacterized membrane protein
MSSRSDEEIRHEAKQEAAPALGIVLLILVALAVVSRSEGWEVLNRVSWWSWLVLAVPALVLFLDFRFDAGMVSSRRIALVAIHVLVLCNLVNLLILVGGLVSTSSTHLSGGELLFSAAAIWATNVIVFGLWFWEIDSGGPVARERENARESPDFQFPQDENRELARPGWKPVVWDYLYISLTNSIAFSATDAMPLTRHAKGLMAFGSLISVVTVLLVGARAVNVLNG